MTRLRRMPFAVADATGRGQRPADLSWREAQHRLPRRRVSFSQAGWLLPVLLLTGAVASRSFLGPDWVGLTAVNVACATALVGVGRRRPHRTAWAWAGAIVLLFGGFIQLLWLGYKLRADPMYIIVYSPDLSWLQPEDVVRAYGAFTLLFSAFCLLASVWIVFGPTPRFATQPTSINARHLKIWIVRFSLGYVVLTLVQIVLGFGQFGGASSSGVLLTPLSLYRQNFFPGVLVVGLWVFDGRDSRWWFGCLAGLGAVSAIEAYISTSRGTVFTYGLPILFLWYLCRRFLKVRKAIVIGGLAVYFLVNPLLTNLRAERLQATLMSGYTLPQDTGLSVGGLTQTLDHTLIRVGGAEGLLTAQHVGASLGTPGILDLMRPNFMTDYYTYNIVGIPKAAPIADFRSPAALGNTVLVGGALGAAGVLAFLVFVFGMTWWFIVRFFRSWPVGCALFCGSVVSYVSEGAMVTVYKYLLVALALEWLCRRLSRSANRGGTSGRATFSTSATTGRKRSGREPATVT